MRVSLRDSDSTEHMVWLHSAHSKAIVRATYSNSTRTWWPYGVVHRAVRGDLLLKRCYTPESLKYRNSNRQLYAIPRYSIQRQGGRWDYWSCICFCSSPTNQILTRLTSVYLNYYSDDQVNTILIWHSKKQKTTSNTKDVCLFKEC